MQVAEAAEIVGEAIIAAKREIQTWGEQAPTEVQLLIPGIENYIDAKISAGENVDELMAALNSKKMQDAVDTLDPLIALAENNPEQLAEALAVQKAIDEDKVFTDEKGMQHIIIDGTRKLPLKTEVLEALGTVNEAVEAVAESDSAMVVGMLLTGLRGVPGMVVEAAVGATIGDDIEEVKEVVAGEVSAWGVDKNTDEFGEDLADEQRYGDGEIHTDVAGGSVLVVDLVAAAVLGAAAKKLSGKGGDKSEGNNDTPDNNSSVVNNGEVGDNTDVASGSGSPNGGAKLDNKVEKPTDPSIKNSDIDFAKDTDVSNYFQQNRQFWK